MLRPLAAALLVALVAASALAGPPAKKSAAVAALASSPEARMGIQSRMLAALIELSAEHCNDEGGKLVVRHHEWNEDALRWEEKAARPSDCSFDAHDALEALRYGARFAQESTPDWSKAKEIELASYQLLSDETATDAAAKTLFGHDLVKKREPVASGGSLIHYNPQAIEAAFQALYVPPDESRAGYALQALYDALFKRSIAGFAEQTALVLAKKELFRAQGKTFAQRLKDPAFYPRSFAEESAASYRVQRGDDDRSVDAAHLGMLLRRSADGTLPVMLGALIRILQDYDPATARSFAGKLSL